MPTLRNKATGVVVEVDETTAAALGAGYEPVTGGAKTEPKAKPAPRSR